MVKVQVRHCIINYVCEGPQIVYKYVCVYVGVLPHCVAAV